jgi:DNA polymerase III subunit delta'
MSLRFSDVLGQGPVLEMLRESLAAGTLHHALAFVGPEGVGKRTTALALAARILCGAARDGDACGECDACHQVTAGSHPDFHREALQPLDEKGRDLRSEVLLSQAHEVQRFLGGRALTGRKKIVVIDDAEALNLEAQNALLKTLEEPPRNSLVVLVCHSAARLQRTVRSRCQRVAFAPLDREIVETILRSRLGLSEADAHLVATYSQGSVAFAGDVDALREAHERVSKLLRDARELRYESIAAAATALVPRSTKGLPLEVTVLLAQLRAMLRSCAGIEEPRELTPRGKTGTLIDALRATEAVYDAVVDLGFHANRRLAVERMWLRTAEHL